MDPESGLLLIPARNEAETLEGVLGEVAAHMHPHIRVVVVDDGSIDATAEIVQSCGIDLIRTQTHMGKARAVRWAAHALLNSHHRLLVVMDGDGQHEPSDARRIIRELESGKRAAFSTRFSTAADSAVMPDRALLAEMTESAMNRSFGFSRPDPACGLLGLQRSDWDAVSKSMKHGRHFPVELFVRLRSEGMSTDDYTVISIAPIYDTRVSHYDEKYASTDPRQRLEARIASHLEVLNSLANELGPQPPQELRGSRSV